MDDKDTIPAATGQRWASSAGTLSDRSSRPGAILDLGFRTLHASDVTRQLLGCSIADAVFDQGRRRIAGLPASDPEQARAALLAGDPWTEQACLLRPTDAKRSTLVRFEALRDPQGDVSLVNVFVLQSDTPECIEQSEPANLDALEFMADTSEMLFLAVDERGSIVRFSRSCEALSGLSRNALAGTPVVQALKQVQVGGRSHAFLAPPLGRSSDKLWRHETEWVDCNGRRRHVVWVTRLQPGDGPADSLRISIGLEIASEGTAVDRPAHNARLLRQSQAVAKVGSWQLDLAAGLLQWSDEVYRLFEIDRAKFGASYEAFLDLVHPADREMVRRVYQNSLAGKTPYQIEHRLQMPDGRIKWVEERCESEFDASGVALRSFGTVQDVTDRKQAELALQISVERLRQAVRVAHIGIFDHDHTTNEIYWSPELREIYGVPAESTSTLEFCLSFVHPEDRDRIAAAIALAHDPAGSGLYDVEHRVVRPDGEVRWATTRSQTFFSGSGDERRPIRTCGALMDITDLKALTARLQHVNLELEERVEERNLELASRHRQNRLIVDSSMDGFVMIDSEGFITGVNTAACAIYGYEREELIGMRITRLEAHEVRTAIGTRISNFLAQGSGRFETRARRKNGEEFDLEVSAKAVRMDGKVLLFGFVRDITDRLAATRQLLEAKEQAEKATRAKSALLSRVSHELRTPLNAIIGFGQLLGEAGLRQPKVQHLSEILKAGEHLRLLIDEMLDLSTVEAGRIRLSLQPVDLAALTREAAALMAPAAAQAGIRIQLPRSADTTPIHVAGDPGRLRQVLLNLLSNAIKYNRPRGRVLLDWQSISPHQAAVAVTDEGPGLAKDELGRLFEPFERLGRESSSVQGHGVGLSVSKLLVEMMSGRIEVASEPGRGSTFRVLLPVAQGAGSNPATADRETAKARGGDLRAAGRLHRILHVDPDPSGQRLMRRILERNPQLEIVSASNPQEALSFVSAGGVDCVLVDLDSPLQAGRDLLSRIRATGSTVPVVAIGSPQSTSLRPGPDEGGYSLLFTRPFEVGAVLASLQDMLAGDEALTG